MHALRGHDGSYVLGFPYRAGGRVQAPPTIAPLHGRAPRGSSSSSAASRQQQQQQQQQPRSQHVAVMAFDGLLHLIDGATGCGHAVDVGEASYAAVLVDDVDGSGNLDLIVATMNGNVYAFGTAAEYHPLKTWPAQAQAGGSGAVSRWGYFGAFATPASRAPRDVAGRALRVNVEVVDRRARLERGTGRVANATRGGPYNVTVLLRGVGVAEMNAGEQPVIGVADSFQTAGVHAVELPCPRTRTTATVRVEISDHFGARYVDEFALSFHVHFHKLLKYLVALPLLLSALAGVAAAAHALSGNGGVDGAYYDIAAGVKD